MYSRINDCSPDIDILSYLMRQAFYFTTALPFLSQSEASISVAQSLEFDRFATNTPYRSAFEDKDDHRLAPSL